MTPPNQLVKCRPLLAMLALFAFQQVDAEVTITPISPIQGATGAGLAGGKITLQANVSDSEGEARTVTFYGRPKSPEPGDDFTLVAIPDTQNYTDVRDATNDLPNFVNQTEWIVGARESLNIAFVSHLGDVAQSYNGEPQEYVGADLAMSVIEDPVTTSRQHGIPWGVTPGNHDLSFRGTDSSLFNQYFGISRFAGRDYYQGNYGTNNDNNYQFFSASGLDFIVINLRYEAGSSDPAILEWADAVLKAHPERRAIVTSHNLLQESGDWQNASWHGHGRIVYEELRDNPNLFLMLCGHRQEEGMRTEIFEGNKVYLILSDYQGRAGHGDSWLRYYVFSPVNNTITAKTYQTKTGIFETDQDSEFSLEYNLGGPLPWVELETVSLEAGVNTASTTWTGVDPETGYEWYAAASNGTTGSSTAIQAFTTPGNLSPSVELSTPIDQASFTISSNIEFSATAEDPDGTISKVEFYADGQLLGEDQDAPYQLAWTPPLSGTYPVFARAIDNQGQGADSAERLILVTNPENTAPSVTFLSPGENSPLQTGSHLLRVEASDEDGIIQKVEFLVNGTKLGEVTQAPYELNWNAEVEGIFNLAVIATDNDDGEASSEVQVSVRDTTTLVFQQGLNGYSGASDTFISMSDPDQVFWNNPSSEISNRLGSVQQAMIRFDDIFGSGEQQIPTSDAMIISADLEIWRRSSETETLKISALQMPWDDGSTWNNSFGGDGIQLGHPETSDLVVRQEENGISVAFWGFDAKRLVQDWASGEANHGVTIFPESQATLHTYTTALLRMGEYFFQAHRPMLTVEYFQAKDGEVFIFCDHPSVSETADDAVLPFKITRAGTRDEPLTVMLEVGGTAEAGLDYQGLPESITIPANQSTTEFSLSVQKDGLGEGPESIVIKILESPDYQVGVWPPATALIEDTLSQQYFFDTIADPDLRGSDDDADGDQVPNLLEYYHGSDLNDASERSGISSPQFGYLLFPDSNIPKNLFVIEYPRWVGARNFNAFFEWSSDMVNWYREGQKNGEILVAFRSGQVQGVDNGIESVASIGEINGPAVPESLYFRLVVAE